MTARSEEQVAELLEQSSLSVSLVSEGFEPRCVDVLLLSSRRSRAKTVPSKRAGLLKRPCTAKVELRSALRDLKGTAKLGGAFGYSSSRSLRTCERCELRHER